MTILDIEVEVEVELETAGFVAVTGDPSVCADLVDTGTLGRTGEGSGIVELLVVAVEVKERIVKGPTEE